MLCFVVTTCVFYSCHDKEKTTGKSVWVKVDTVKSSTRNEVLQFPARVKASQEVNMAFKISGILQQVFVKEGERFKRVSCWPK